MKARVMCGLMGIVLASASSAWAGEQCFTLKLQRQDLPLLLATLAAKRIQVSVQAPEKRTDGHINPDGSIEIVPNLDESGKALLVFVSVRVSALTQGAAEDKAWQLYKQLQAADNGALTKYYEHAVLGSWGLGSRSCKGFDSEPSEL
jgi:hypothetical protein